MKDEMTNTEMTNDKKGSVFFFVIRHSSFVISKFKP